MTTPSASERPPRDDAPASDLPWYREVSGPQWKAFWAAWLGYLLDGFDFVIITLVLTEVADEFHLSTVQATTLISAAFVSRWFGGLVLGAVADTIGRRQAMVAAIVTFSVGSALCAVSTGYLMMFVARLLIGFGMAGEYSASATYVIESWPQHLRNKASAFLISGFSIGGVLVAQLYRFVVPAWGWRALFALGLVPIVLALWLRRSLPEPADFEHAKRSGDLDAAPDMFTTLYRGGRAALNVVLTLVVFAALLVIFTGHSSGALMTTVLALMTAATFVWFLVQFEPERWPTALGVTLVVFTVFFFAWPITALLPTYLKTELHLSAATVGDVLFWSGFGTAAGAVLAGFTGDRFGTTRAYWGSLALSIPLLWPIFTMSGSHVVLIGVMLFVQQCFGSGVGGLVPKWMVSWFTLDKRAAGLGFTYNGGALGGAISPVVGAQLAGRMPLGSALMTLSATFTGVVILLVALKFPLRLQRLIRPSAVRPEDGSDIVTRATSQAV